MVRSSGPDNGVKERRRVAYAVEGVEGVEGVGKSTRTRTRAAIPPTSWAEMNPGADPGAIPAKEFENMRPTVIAGFAKLVELVKK